jgi:Peptidase propeptide and YPEB domain
MQDMRKAASIGIGAGAAAIVAMSAGVAAAAATGGQQAGGSAAAARSASAASSVNKHITRHQAAVIARAKVPHSRVIEIESDDLHDRQVWKVQLHTAHGRVIVDVDKKTGNATIIRHGGHRGPGDVRRPGGDRGTALLTGAAARDDHGRDGHGRDDRDEDAAQDAAEHRGDRAGERGDDHGRDGRHHHHRGRDHRDRDRADDNLAR